MTRFVFHADRKSVPDEPDGDVHVWLYGSSPPYDHVGTVGARAYDAATRLSLQPSRAAMDLLSIAMAVTAADTFILRADEPDGWRRTFECKLPLSEPERWLPLKADLEATLRFLSSDLWHFEFTSGGMDPPPLAEIKSRNRVVNLAKVDCVSLFSGGLDSAIGALDLIGKGIRPLLVSHASSHDADKQNIVSSLLPSACERMSVNSYPTWAGADEDSQRTRSFQFLALGVLAAEAVTRYRRVSKADLFVCENGLIALNPPLPPAEWVRTVHERRIRIFWAASKPYWMEREFPSQFQIPIDTLPRARWRVPMPRMARFPSSRRRPYPAASGSGAINSADDAFPVSFAVPLCMLPAYRTAQTTNTLIYRLL